MAFVSQLCEPPFRFDVTEQGGIKAVTFLVGHDPVLPATYFVLVSLDGTSDPAQPEYQFAIVRRRIADDQEDFIFDGRETRQLFATHEREWLLYIIVSATLRLLETFRPEAVFRCIMVGNAKAQRNALRKHELVNWAFDKAGYDTIRCDEFNDRQIWLARRRAGTER